MKLKTMTADEFVSRVADDLVAALEGDRALKVADIARTAGYSTVSVRQFRSGQYRSFRLAVRLTEVVPEIAEDIRCKCCGGLPPITF